MRMIHKGFDNKYKITKCEICGAVFTAHNGCRGFCKQCGGSLQMWGINSDRGEEILIYLSAVLQYNFVLGDTPKINKPEAPIETK